MVWRPLGATVRRRRRPTTPPPLLAVDSTGVGRPVMDVLAAADLPGDLVGITITGGDTVERTDPARELKPPRGRA